MFSALERNLIFNTIRKCQRSGTAEHLEEILAYFIGSFIPHKMSVCGVGNLLTGKHLCRLDFGCPPGLIDELRPVSYAKNDFLMSMWQQHRAPLYTNIADWDDSRLNAEQRRWRRALGRHGVHNMAMHGVVDTGGGVASFFYLGALAEPLDARQAEILCMLAPHLHRVLLKLAQSNCAPAAAESTRSTRKATGGLTRREAEILKWIYHGKTNSEAAVILGISELTVRNHMQKLMLKMGVGNRTQAVVKALQNNIFSDDPVPK